MAGNGEQAASVLVAALEQAWTAIRRRHPDVPDVVMVMASGSQRRSLKLGHFAALRWEVQGADCREVMVGGEGLRFGAHDVLGTLLHEAAHGLTLSRGIKDTSRDGRYHNKHFRALAAELGLDVVKTGSIGWSATSVPEALTAEYRPIIEQLAMAMALVLWRRAEPNGGGKTTRNLLACVCDCGRKIRVARGTLEDAPIICGQCDTAFEAVDDQEG
jgi:hypothetical protein